MENRLETLTMTTVGSTLSIQTGADNTILRNSSLQICAAHVVVASQVDLMRVKMEKPTKETRVMSMREMKAMTAKPTKEKKVMTAKPMREMKVKTIKEKVTKETKQMRMMT